MPKISNIMLRIEPKDKRRIIRAAKLDKRTMSDFIRIAAVDKANKLIDQETRKR